MSIGLIKLLYCTSWFFSIVLAVNILLAVFNRIRKHTVRIAVFSNKRQRSFKTKLLVASLFLIGAVWSLRFAVGYYSVFNPPEGSIPLTLFEEFFNSLVHTLATFSLDEDYTAYITAGRKMMTAVYGEGSKAADIYGGYAAVLNCLVPVAGGAIVFEIISEFSPWVRLKFANARVRTEKYYFSKLNDPSLALAKNIVDIGNSKACIIFADAYAEEDGKSDSERLAGAKSIGAICLKNDLMSIRLRGRKPKVFLIDESEIRNLQALTSLLDRPDNIPIDSEIYVFSSDKKYSNIDDEVSFIVNKKTVQQYEILTEQKKQKISERLSKEKRTDYTDKAPLTDCLLYYNQKYIPTVIPVNGVRNMIMNLFSDVPLYEPLIDKEKDDDGKKTLNVTIIGSGVIGTEAFLSAYWCGQMLDCKLSITVVSKEKQNKKSKSDRKGDFEGRINYINPDIFMTSDPNSSILKYLDDAPPSAPYFSYDYKESDVMSDDFIALMNDSGLLDTDYYIIALGSDEDNLTVANRLRQLVGERHLFSEKQNKTIISYVVYNSELSRALNENNRHKYSLDSRDSSACDVIMRAFGSQESVYSVKNVFFEGNNDASYDVGELYESKKKGLNDDELIKKKGARFKDIYTYRANLAREYHRKYREFSAGFHKVSLFNAKDIQEECFKQPKKDYLDFIASKISEDPSKRNKLHRLAWLEHRRWCAYMRINGFRNLDKKKNEDYSKYYFRDLPEHGSKDHKFVSLKLHPCLVECSEDGISADLDEYGLIKEETEFKGEIVKDYLDVLSRSRHAIDPQKEDFKQWDYPENGLSKSERARLIRK